MSAATLESNVKKKIDEWLNGSFDEDTKNKVRKLLEENRYDELTDAFYQDLEFGTGGLRGIMGVGSNRMNKYTVGKATQGLCNYLKAQFPNEQIKFVIAHDCRNQSDYFAKIVADVCSANDIKVYFFNGLRPTPELSFAIKELDCKSGVMLTASHNPKEYNGYKAYWEDGGQLVAPHDKNVIAEVNKITDIAQVKFEAKEENIETIGEEIDRIYLNKIMDLSLRPDAVKKEKNLKIVFSPIHGTAIMLVPQALEKWGFENVHVVEEQATPDGNFPTVIFPNPEEEEAMQLSLKKAKTIGADLVMACDPDGDRVGVGVKNRTGTFQLLNGNQICSLLVHYVISSMKELGKLPDNPYVVKTIVTSPLISEIAQKNHINCYETLTGFKHIGALITKLEGKENFIAGGEESYGYLVGDLVRDKDAVVSCTMIAEMTAYYKSQGKSLFDALLEIYSQYGFYKEKLISITKKGKSGAEEIKKMMQELRDNPPAKIAGSPVVKISDYQAGFKKDMASGRTKTIDLPKSNVLQFVTEDSSIISARPSGTEPKIKFYSSAKAVLKNTAEYEEIEAKLEEKLKQLTEALSG
ncbi:MAG: phospho-sugar mutase [Chitinophagales bacterium]